MAGKFNAFLKGAASGFLQPKGLMGDWQHAARTFVDDYFRLAPKAKFLYYCYFNINAGALKFPQLDQRHRNEIGLLVKQVDFPKFTVKTQTINQYNRKKVVQTGHDYGPINFRFHDDRANIVNMLWQSYYTYYYADPSTSKTAGAYHRNAYRGFDTVKGPHGFDNNSSIPFFREIVLYQLNNRNFVSYTLVNPMIQSFSHDTAQSSEQNGGTSECSMTLNYEAVNYDMDSIDSGKVKGFAQDHYDTQPSPLSIMGGGARSLLGKNGVLDGVATAAEEFSKGNILGALVAGANTFNNAKKLTKSGIKNETKNLLTNTALGAIAAGASAVRGTSFPGTTQSTRTVATQRTDLVNPNELTGGGA